MFRIAITPFGVSCVVFTGLKRQDSGPPILPCEMGSSAMFSNMEVHVLMKLFVVCRNIFILTFGYN